MYLTLDDVRELVSNCRVGTLLAFCSKTHGDVYCVVTATRCVYNTPTHIVCSLQLLKGNTGRVQTYTLSPRQVTHVDEIKIVAQPHD